jgi:uncharacterized protein (TIGR00730 family)
MATVKRLCVYCGSCRGNNELFRLSATRLGTLLARSGIEVVFGGGRVGLMGLVADAALAAGGRVTGIIPGHLHEREVGHPGLSELVIVENMHQRKRRMFELADGFIVLPGGLGTLDETFEIITWKQLGLHDKPVIIVDIDGYWAPLRGLIDHVIGEGFTSRTALNYFRVVADVEEILPTIASLPEPTAPVAAKLV